MSYQPNYTQQATTTTVQDRVALGDLNQSFNAQDIHAFSQKVKSYVPLEAFPLHQYKGGMYLPYDLSVVPSYERNVVFQSLADAQQSQQFADQQEQFQDPAFQQFQDAPGFQQFQDPAFQQFQNAPGLGPQDPAFQQFQNAPGYQQGQNARGLGPQDPAFQQFQNAPGYQQGQNAPGFQQGQNAPGSQQGQNAPGFQQGQNAPGFQQGQNARGLGPQDPAYQQGFQGYQQAPAGYGAAPYSDVNAAPGTYSDVNPAPDGYSDVNAPGAYAQGPTDTHPEGSNVYGDYGSALPGELSQGQPAPSGVDQSQMLQSTRVSGVSRGASMIPKSTTKSTQGQKKQMACC